MQNHAVYVDLDPILEKKEKKKETDSDTGQHTQIKGPQDGYIFFG